MRRIFTVVILGLLALGLLSPLIAPRWVYADKPPDKIKIEEVLPFGTERLDEYTTRHLKGTHIENGQLMQDWGVTISVLPETLPDLKTKIIVEWRKGQSSDGIVFYENGNNIYYAKVTGTRVTVEYQGILAAWDPIVYIGNTQLKLTAGPRPVKDPLGNKNYGANTIEWVYEKSGGLFGQSYRVLRYLRQIEGLLQEFYVLETNPEAPFRVVNAYAEEEGFRWTGAVYAYDSAGLSLIVTGDDSGKFIDARELNRPELTYPVIIDPPTPFTTSSYDGGYSMWGTTYNEAWIGSNGGLDLGTNPSVYVGQSSGYSVQRAWVMFYTASLLGKTIISPSYLSLYGQHDSSETNFYVIVQEGMPTYPHMPQVQDDFAASHYSGDGGSISTIGWSLTGYNTLTLNDEGMGWINKEGWTKFCLRSSRDISQTTPTQLEDIGFYAYEKGTGYQPKLYVSYTSPVVKPEVSSDYFGSVTETSVILYGTVTNDGGAPCDTYFDFGTTTSYLSGPTSSAGTKTTGQSFSKAIPGLLSGTLYHWTARATHGSDTSDEDHATFLTRPTVPTAFVVTPGDSKNDLSWTPGIGSGSVYTVIRRSTTGAPSTPSSGTGVYNSTGTSHSDEGLINGQPYYYSAWAYVAGGDWAYFSSTYVSKSGTPVALGPPTVVTYNTTLVTETTATFNGYLTSLGGESSADLYFQYYWGTGNWGDNEVAAEPATLAAPGSFYYNVGSLPASTLIHVRAMADNGNVTQGNGLDNPFTTGAVCAPSINTTSYGPPTSTSTTLYGLVVDDGGSPGDITVDFLWGTTNPPGESVGQTSGLQTGSIFNTPLPGLAPSTVYYFQARGWNNQGNYGYGEVLNFTTIAPSNPSVTTLTPGSPGATSITLNGQLVGDGGAETSVRFSWSTNVTLSENITSSVWQAGKRSGELFNQFVYNLTCDTTYYCRAEAFNVPGIVINSTAIRSFTTIFIAPTQFTAIALTSTSISITWIPQSDKVIIFAKVGSFPVDRLDPQAVQVYIGPGSSTTYDDLDPGVTYFFRAWSWRVGDVYSSAYAEDAATTLSAGGVDEIETPYDEYELEDPVIPTSWWQGSGSDNIQKWPLIPYIDSIAASMGMDNKVTWALIGGLLMVLAGLVGAIVLSGKLGAVFSIWGVAGIFTVIGVFTIIVPVIAIAVGIIVIILIPGGQ